MASEIRKEYINEKEGLAERPEQEGKSRIEHNVKTSKVVLRRDVLYKQYEAFDDQESFNSLAVAVQATENYDTTQQAFREVFELGDAAFDVRYSAENQKKSQGYAEMDKDNSELIQIQLDHDALADQVLADILETQEGDRRNELVDKWFQEKSLSNQISRKFVTEEIDQQHWDYYEMQGNAAYIDKLGRSLAQHFSEQANEDTRDLEVALQASPDGVIDQSSGTFSAIQVRKCEQVLKKWQSTGSEEDRHWQELLQSRIDRYHESERQVTTYEEYVLGDAVIMKVEIHGPIDEGATMDMVIESPHGSVNLKEFAPPGTIFAVDKPRYNEKPRFAAKTEEDIVLLPFAVEQSREKPAHTIYSALHEVGHLHQKGIDRKASALTNENNTKASVWQAKAVVEVDAWNRADSYAQEMRDRIGFDLESGFLVDDSLAAYRKDALTTYQLSAELAMSDNEEGARAVEGLFAEAPFSKRSLELAIGGHYNLE